MARPKGTHLPLLLSPVVLTLLSLPAALALAPAFPPAFKSGALPLRVGYAPPTARARPGGGGARLARMALLGGGQGDALGQAVQGALHLAHAHAPAKEVGEAVVNELEETAKFSFGNPILDNIFGRASGWSFILTTIVLLLAQAFESAVHYIEHNIPKAQLPVIRGVVSELATLGFVAVLVSGLELGGEESLLTYYSTLLFGEPELLFEEFESIDKGLFSVTVSFFAAFSVLLTVVNLRFRTWDQTFRSAVVQLRLAEDEARRKGVYNPDDPQCRRVEDDYMRRFIVADPAVVWGFGLDELFSSEEVRLSEFYTFRKRFLQRAVAEGVQLDDNFRFYQYLEENAAEDLKEIVSIEPLQLISALVPLAAITITNEIFAESVLGEGGAETGLLVTYILSQGAILIWAVWNFLKMSYVKTMLKPRVVRKEEGGTVTYDIIPPSYVEHEHRQTPAIINTLSILEYPWRQPAKNVHEELFGYVGAQGPMFYLQSMKLLLFESIVSFSFGSQLLGKDFGELTPFINLAILPSMVAVALAPTTFLMYNWATGVEQLRNNDLVTKVLARQREEKFRTTLRTLITIINRFLEVSDISEALPRRSYDQVEREWEVLMAEECPNTILELRDIFQSHDLDGSGELEEKELLQLAKDLGFDLDGEIMRRFKEHLGSRRCFDFKEFATTMMKSNGEKIQSLCPEQIGDQVFNFFDIDGAGTISEDEMLNKLKPLGFDAQGIEQLFLDVTGKHKNVVTRSEFQTYLEKRVLGDPVLNLAS